MEILEEQRDRFRQKFGRYWGPNDPVFFDPDADTPTPMLGVKVQAEVLEAMRKAGTPPEIMYAYKKTEGLLYVEGMSENWSRGRVKEWKAAIDEYFAIEAAQAANTDRPDPTDWKTEIPELLVSGFNRQDLKKIDEILHAVAQIESLEPIKVVTRIELAAAFLVMACECAYDSAEATESPGQRPNLYAKTEEIVMRRAREIYAQGSTGSG
jgi:hypothetical protein